MSNDSDIVLTEMTEGQSIILSEIKIAIDRADRLKGELSQEIVNLDEAINRLYELEDLNQQIANLSLENSEQGDRIASLEETISSAGLQGV